jgi:hypothetical protein
MPGANESGDNLESTVSEPAESTPSEGAPEQAGSTAPEAAGGEQSPDFLAMPEDMPDELKGQLEDVRSKWQAAYTQKRQAETSELKELRGQLDTLKQDAEAYRALRDDPKALKMLYEQFSRPEPEQDPYQQYLEGLGDEDARTTRQMLEAVETRAEQRVFEKLNPLLQQVQASHAKQIEQSLDQQLGAGFTQKHRPEMLKVLQQIEQGDQQTLMRAAAYMASFDDAVKAEADRRSAAARRAGSNHPGASPGAGSVPRAPAKVPVEHGVTEAAWDAAARIVAERKAARG